MPRKAKDAQDGEVHQDQTSNEISAERLKGFVAEYEAELAEIDKINARAALDCQPHNDSMKEIVKAAAEAGVPKKVFKAKMKERRHLRIAEGADHALSDEMKAIYADVGLKLGPLGEWAKEHAPEFA